MWFCYILRCTDEGHKNLTYNGSTNNPLRRLNEHNGGVKKNGAKATSGKAWEIYALLTGFEDHRNALSCEYRIKKPTGKRGKRPSKYCGVNGRILSLNEVLLLDKWTSKCMIENKNCSYKLYVTFDVAHLIDLKKIPRNIEVYKVNKMNSTFLQGVIDKIY